MTWICSEIIKGHAFSRPTDSKMCPACMQEGRSGFLIKAEEGDHIWNAYMALSNPKPSTTEESTVATPSLESETNDLGSSIEHTTTFAPVELPSDTELEMVIKPEAVSTTPPVQDFEPISPGPETDQSLGLCIIMMDASGSMQYPAFNNDETSKIAMIAKAAANGIFDLRDMNNKRNAYIIMYTFDHRIKFLFMKSVHDIIQKYQTAEAFEAYLHQELDSLDMGGHSDINQALQKAHDDVNKFLNHEIEALKTFYDGKDYPIANNNILNADTLTTKNIPNVRVFMYTDGLQYANGVKSHLINPFKNGGGLADVDLLLGAFIGADAKIGESAYKELQDVLGVCHRHGEKQFFLIDSPEKLDTLKNLFTMSSEGSGFCHFCMSEKVSKSAPQESIMNEEIVNKETVKEEIPNQAIGEDRIHY